MSGFRCYMNCESLILIAITHKQGQLVDGKRDGKGRLINSSGIVTYEGNWKNDQRSGYGISKYDGGDCHEGNYSKDDRHGVGVFLWSDGDKYTGNFDKGSS